MSREEHIVPTHCTENELARLAEGDASVFDAIDWDHFCRCPQCLAAYAETLEHCVDRAVGRQAFPVPEDLLEAGLRTGWKQESDATRPAAPRRPALRIRPAALLSTAAVAMILLIGLPIALQRSGEPRAPLQDEAIRAVLADASRNLESGLLLDGFTAAPTAESVLVRGTAAPAPGLESLERRVQAGDADEDEMYWYLCGKLFAGQVFQVQSVLTGLAPTRAGSVRLQLLEASVAYRQNRLDDAEAILTGILADHPDHSTALFDLAQIAAERGQRVEAAALLARIRIPSDHDLLRYRVSKLRAELGV